MVARNLIKSYFFREWMNFIQHSMSNSFDGTLNRIIYVAKKLGVLNTSAFIFIVGGTNGKGTTCCVLETLLLKLGYHVGLYTSPHLMKYTERVRINGLELDYVFHVESFNDIKRVQGDIILTRFEFITLSALLLFKSYNLDIIILEVGLGGRLDATNILNSDISIITNVDIDHTNILGTSRASISVEKSGIFRRNRISVISDRDFPEISKYIAKQKKVELKIINIDWMYKEFEHGWHFFNNKVTWYNLPLPKVSLCSAASALSAILESDIHISERIFRNCISRIVLKGRCEIVFRNPTIILDVAHNPNSVRYLFKKLLSMKKEGKIYAIVGILRDKDIKNILNPLISIVDYWYCVKLCTNRSVSPEQIIRYLPSSFSQISISMSIALEKVFDIITNIDIILVFGSFFSVHEANNILVQKIRSFK